MAPGDSVRRHRLKRVAIVTLGCPKNEADSARLVTLLGRSFELVDDPAKAVAVVVNTCGFIEQAVEESLRTVMELADLPQRPLVAAVGCMVTRYADEIGRALPEAGLLVELGELHVLDRLLERALEGCEVGPARRPSGVQEPRARASALWEVRPAATGLTAYLTISDGCDRACAYCSIPSIRGRHLSRPPASILEEAEALVEGGARELVVVGQDTGSYGRDLEGGGPSRPDLAWLLGRLDQVAAGRAWVRVMYLQPEDVSEGLLEVMAGARAVVPYLDVPVQHADPRVLRRVGRKGSDVQWATLARRVREALPQAALRTTVISGLPGEDRAAYARLERFVAEGHFDHVGVFAYSQEEGTRAARMKGQVRRDVSERRRQRLDATRDAAWERRAARLVGTDIRVIREGPSDDPRFAWMGRWTGQAPAIDGVVYWTGRAGAPFGRVRVSTYEGHDLIGATDV